MRRRTVLTVGMVASAFNALATCSVSVPSARPCNLPRDDCSWLASAARGNHVGGLRLRGGAADSKPIDASYFSKTNDITVETPIEINGACYGRQCKIPALKDLFPLPTMSLFEPSIDFLTSIAAEMPEVVTVPNRGTTAQACLFKGRRLNPSAFPEGVFINERRALLTGRFDYRTDDPQAIGGIYQDNGEKFYRRGVVCMKRMEFLNLDWCNRARHKDHMVIASRIFGVWTMMTNKIIRETSEETRDYARTTLTFAMTKNHILAGEEQLALHWDKKTNAVAFEVCSFSWPLHPVAALAKPIVQHTQKRAAIDFCERMFSAVRERRFRLNDKTGKVYEATLCTDM